MAGIIKSTVISGRRGAPGTPGTLIFTGEGLPTANPTIVEGAPGGSLYIDTLTSIYYQLNGNPESDGVPADVTALQDAVTALESSRQFTIPVGDAGDVVATTNGIDWLSFKPGRIDARVRGLSTAASDNSTLLGTLLTESGTTGAQLWIPEGTYRANVNVPANARIAGPGTLKPVVASTNWVLYVVGPNTVIEGITVDGESTAKGIVHDGQFNAAGAKHRVDQVTVKNTLLESAIYFLAVTDLLVTRCTFANVRQGVTGYNSHRVRVLNNALDGSVSNAFGIIAETGQVLKGCEWSGNTAISIGRMGIELWASGGGIVDAPLVTGNSMTMSTSPASDPANPTQSVHDNMGYSIVAGRNAVVTGNTAEATNDLARYAAFELGIHPITATNNVARGFRSGILTSSQSYCRIAHNQLIGQYNGIQVQNLGTQTVHTIVGNYIQGFRNNGINFEENAGVHGGHMIEGNTIMHDAEWTGVTEWNGIASYLGWPIPSKANRNTIIQAIAVPTSEGRGINIYVATLGQANGTQVRDNQFIDLATTPTAATLSGLTTKFGDAARMADVVISGNQRTIATGETNDVTTWVT